MGSKPPIPCRWQKEKGFWTGFIFYKVTVAQNCFSYEVIYLYWSTQYSFIDNYIIFSHYCRKPSDPLIKSDPKASSDGNEGAGDEDEGEKEDDVAKEEGKAEGAAPGI